MLDFGLTIPAVIVLSPLFLIIAILVRMNLGSPVLFRQIRIGFREKPFPLLKFRTMSNTLDTNGKLLSDAQRMTRFGALLRKASIDELPELINVLRGDMSLVGPRPLLVQYLPYYTERERLRHTVRPGITGLAQINGRNYLQWDDRLEMDVKYVENISFLRDIRIILQTFFQVLRGKDIAVVPGTVSTYLSEYRRKQKESD